MFEHNFKIEQNTIVLGFRSSKMCVYLESLIRSNTVVMSLPFLVLLLLQHILSLNKDIPQGEREGRVPKNVAFMTFAIFKRHYFKYDFSKTIQIYSLTPKTCFALGLRSLVFKLKCSGESQFFFEIKETKGPSEESIWDSLKK